LRTGPLSNFSCPTGNPKLDPPSIQKPFQDIVPGPNGEAFFYRACIDPTDHIRFILLAPLVRTSALVPERSILPVPECGRSRPAPALSRRNTPYLFRQRPLPRASLQPKYYGYLLTPVSDAGQSLRRTSPRPSFPICRVIRPGGGSGRLECSAVSKAI